MWYESPATYIIAVLVVLAGITMVYPRGVRPSRHQVCTGFYIAALIGIAAVIFVGAEYLTDRSLDKLCAFHLCGRP